MRRPGAPFNPLYLSGGGNSTDNDVATSGRLYAPSTSEFVSAASRRPHSAMAAHPASRRLSSEGSHGAADQSMPVMSSADVKIKHLSLSRRIIELWDVLEIPPHRRQASIGSSMVLLHATAQHVALLRQLIDELEAYRVERERSSKLLFSSLGGTGSGSTTGNRSSNHIYRSHPLDETPLHLRRPVSAALMRSTPSGVPRKTTAWSRPTSAMSTRLNMSAQPVTHELPLAVQPMDVSVIPADEDVNTSIAAAATTIADDAAAADTSRVYRCAAAAEAEASSIAAAASAGHDQGLVAPRLLGSTALRSAHEANVSQNAIGVAGPPLRGNTTSLVDASTMTIESYLVQDSAIVKELMRVEDIERHDVTEQYARPMSKLYLLFLTRISDLEERLLRGLVRSDKEKQNDKTKDNDLLDALTGGGSQQEPRNVSETRGVSGSLLKKLTMDEAMQRVFLCESAERIAEIEFAFLVTRLEEESRRSALCDVLEADSWRRLISFFITSLSTSLFQGLTIVPTAYLRRYDLEREEHFARVNVENVILRSLRVFTVTDDLTLAESRARKAILQEEAIVDAVLSMAISESVTAAYNGIFLKLAASEQGARSEMRDALLSMLYELHQRFQRELSDAKRTVQAYADAAPPQAQPLGETHTATEASQDPAMPLDSGAVGSTTNTQGLQDATTRADGDDIVPQPDAVPATVPAAGTASNVQETTTPGDGSPVPLQTNRSVNVESTASASEEPGVPAPAADSVAAGSNGV